MFTIFLTFLKNYVEVSYNFSQNFSQLIFYFLRDFPQVAPKFSRILHEIISKITQKSEKYLQKHTFKFFSDIFQISLEKYVKFFSSFFILPVFYHCSMNRKYRYLSITVPEVSILIDSSLYRYFPSVQSYQISATRN